MDYMVFEVAFRQENKGVYEPKCTVRVTDSMWMELNAFCKEKCVSVLNILPVDPMRKPGEFMAIFQSLGAVK